MQKKTKMGKDAKKGEVIKRGVMWNISNEKNALRKKILKKFVFKKI